MPSIRICICYILQNCVYMFVLLITKTYWMVSGRTVIPCGEEDDGREEESYQEKQEPEGKLPLDHMIGI